MNSEITGEEILKCISKLKNNKASGDDKIVNEYIKASADLLLPLYVKLLNLIFDTGIIPDAWLTGNIHPIYKGKGNNLDPNNFRPITILSCFGKLFTAVLNDRLTKFSDDFSVIYNNQSGFRKNYSTVDNIFILHIMFEFIKNKKRKKLFCAFIDFAKAFDSVWRNGLWYKLILNNINGKIYRVIVNMYNNIKSRVMYNDDSSDFFPCNIGVRQGENLSPLLFSLYLNDLTYFLCSKNIDGLSSISDSLQNDIDMYIKLFILLYADDTVLMAETKEDLQCQLQYFSEYCDLWKLNVNVSK